MMVYYISTNVSFFNNYVKDTTNITETYYESIIINSTIHDVSNNVTLFQTYAKDTINTIIRI